MQYAVVAALLAGLSVSHAAPAPVAQGLDFSAIETAAPAAALGPPMDAVSQAPAEVYKVATVTEALAAAMETAGVEAVVDKVIAKRQLGVNDPCGPQPDGFGPKPPVDTDIAFLAYSVFADAARAAGSPAGYIKSFTNLKASVSMSTYMGLYTLQTYDPWLCAEKCNQAQGCLGINLFYERDPTVNPANACPNPASFTNIKCTLWGSEVTPESATNAGQWRGPMDANGQAFHVVIAGSIGYSKDRSAPASQAGYTQPEKLQCAMNAVTKRNPVTMKDEKVYIGATLFRQQYDPAVCASLCKTVTAENKQKAQERLAKCASDKAAGVKETEACKDGTTGAYEPCNYFNSYVLSKNNVPEGMYCSLYTQPMDATFATNCGETKGNDRFTISNSYAFSASPQQCSTLNSNGQCPA